MIACVLTWWSFPSLEHLRLRQAVAAGHGCSVPILALYVPVLGGHASSTEQSVEAVYSSIRRESASVGDVDCLPFKRWKGTQDLKKFLLRFYLLFFYEFVWLNLSPFSTCSAEAWRGCQIPLGLELQAVFSILWVLGVEPKSFGKAASVPNGWDLCAPLQSLKEGKKQTVTSLIIIACIKNVTWNTVMMQLLYVSLCWGSFECVLS